MFVHHIYPVILIGGGDGRMRTQTKIQLFIVMTGLICLGYGIGAHQRMMTYTGIVALMIWWWMYLREDHLDAFAHFTRRKWSERRIRKKMRFYEEELEQADGYIKRFAATFNVQFPSMWELTSNDTLILATSLEIAGNKQRLKTLVQDLQELLFSNSIEIDDMEILILCINRAVHEHRVEHLTQKLLDQMPAHYTIEDILLRYIDLIGDVRPEEYGVRPLYCQTRYLAQFLLNHFDLKDLAEFVERKRIRYSVQILENVLDPIIQEQIQTTVRAKRVQILRDLLQAKKPPSLPKTIELFDELSESLFVQEVLAMFAHAGYRVHKVSEEGQGADAILEKLGERIVLRAALVSPNQRVTLSIVQQTHAARAFYEGDRAFLVTNRDFDSAAIALAGRVGIQLFDRQHLTSLIRRFYDVDTDYVTLLYGSKNSYTESIQAQSETIPLGMATEYS
jgi:HJR/Mrr/RecB family endonuclease